MMGVRFVDVAATSAAVAETSGRLAKINLLAASLRRLADPADGGGDPVTIAAGAAFLAGELRQRQTGVGWASVRDVPAPAEVPTLTVGEVDAAIERLSAVAGTGSQAERRRLLHALYAAATADEQRLLTGLLTGELRQGAQIGLLIDAVGKAAQVPAPLVRRALLLAGDGKTVAVAALTGGASALAEFRLAIGRPLAPMLAQSAPSVAAAIEATGTPAAADIKIDGVRIQVHRDGSDVAVFSRSLDDLTARVPGVVAAVRALPVTRLVLDGEAVGVDAAGRPVPFQETSSRAATRRSAGSGGRAAASGGQASGSGGPPSGSASGSGALQPFFFDLLHCAGGDLLDEPASRRWSALDDVVPDGLRVGRTIVSTVDDAAAAFARALDAGQEGLVLKAVDAPYDVGRRGSAWVKVKPRHTLDLVILAVERGHGRRQGWLSNLHLGARDAENGGFVMLGKTFKGLTDEMLRWQTERLRALAVDDNGWVVTVRPEVVVEIAFDGVQTSPRYPGGVALRFARVVRYREDKRADEADTIDAVRAIHTGRTAAG
jgi:DNA ligase-1